MKLKIQFLYALMAVPMMLNAQSVDDDMYFVPGKKSSNSRTTVSNTASTTARQTLRVPVNSVDTVADYHTGTLRDVDDYNRRGGTQMSARLVGDTLYLDSVPQRNDRSIRDYDQRGYYDDYDYYDDDYYYSSRLMRYRGYHFYDPFMWDFCYGWYDPWYDPWYGWYGPYYRHGFYSWYDWGWGWHHRPGWDLGWYWGGYYGPYWGGYHPGHRTGYIYSNGGRRLGSGNTGFTSRSGSRGGRVSAPTGTRGNVTRSGTRGNVEYNGSRGGGLNRQGSVSGTTRGMRGEPSVNNSTRSSRSTVRGNNESNVNTRGTTTNSRGTTSSSSRGTTSSVTRGSSSSSSSSSRGGGFSGGGGSRGGGFSGGGGGGFSGGGGSRGGGGRGGR